MITQFRIENFKSIENLSIDLGRVNVFIGENGAGKSNILEAFALASAAAQYRLDNEFLAARGIRVTAPGLMRAAFEQAKTSQNIKFGFTINVNKKLYLELSNDNLAYSKWESKLWNDSKKLDDTPTETDKNNAEIMKLITNYSRDDRSFHPLINPTTVLEFQKAILSSMEIERSFKNFLIFSPENTSLRTFEKEGQIEPLGIYGEGLFKLLKYFSSEEKEKLAELKQHLKLFDWFVDFSIPKKLFEGESLLQIKDRFLDKKIGHFDQKSSNEGFLFILFYFALLISDKTPSFFAIDNIESSLNPKMCTKLIKSIAELSGKNNRQVIATTHSPAVLDGLDLNNPQQKLFLVYRNKLGRTTVKNIEKPKPLDGQEPIKLSEAFLRGYIGGLPKNFSI